jgi:DNA-binding transcriptional regulator YdaS (Cro superfamily)|tara:strand:+ start:1663 stop:2025 length:363 start_codon:yes stop_codon:yes gene_type:complete
MIDAQTPFEALEAAVEAAGTQAELARICEVSPTAVWKWIQSSKRMPAEFVLRAEAATGVSRHALRPDIYPRETMQDRRAMRACEMATGQNDTVPCHDVQHSDRFHGVDFKRGLGTKVAGQ